MSRSIILAVRFLNAWESSQTCPNMPEKATDLSQWTHESTVFFWIGWEILSYWFHSTRLGWSKGFSWAWPHTSCSKPLSSLSCALSSEKYNPSSVTSLASQDRFSSRTWPATSMVSRWMALGSWWQNGATRLQIQYCTKVENRQEPVLQGALLTPQNGWEKGTLQNCKIANQDFQ